MEKEKYISEFNDIYTKLEKIAENRTEVALSILGEIQKDRRANEINESRKQALSQKASDKQIAFLKDFGADIKPGLTKGEAFKMIAEMTGSKK